MKRLISFFTLVLILSLFSVKAQTVTDEQFLSNWTLGAFPFHAMEATKPGPGYVQKQAKAVRIAEDFDPANENFDEVWNAIPAANEYPLASVVTGSNAQPGTGDEDFKGSFKVGFNETAMYILVKYHDSSVSGKESLEVMWAQDEFLTPLLQKQHGIKPELTTDLYAYARYEAFGGFKVTFSATGYDGVMTVGPPPAGGATNVQWSGTPTAQTLMSANLFLDSHTTSQAPTTIKNIYTIRYTALTGEMREDFNPTIWENLNNKKGISFDIKVNDVDIVNGTETTKPSYWWNSTHNDCYGLTWFAGFLAPDMTSAVSNISADKNSVFELITAKQVTFRELVNVTVYNSVGAVVKSAASVNQVDLSNLKGFYLIRANDEVVKVVL